MSSDLSVGAVGAAIIAAIVSLIGLIIGKEQKTSEFRQAWIDALRAELIKYMTTLNAIADATDIKYPDQPAKLAALTPHYSKLNEATFGVMLRLNDKEPKSRAVLAAMNDFHALAQDEQTLIPENIRPVEAALLTASKDLLKYEWKRVKRGEWTYRVSKWVSFLIVIGLVGFAVLQSRVASDPPKSAIPPGKQQKVQVPPPPLAPQSNVVQRNEIDKGAGYVQNRL